MDPFSWCRGLGGRVDEVDCGLSEYTDECNAWFSPVAQMVLATQRQRMDLIG